MHCVVTVSDTQDDPHASFSGYITHDVAVKVKYDVTYHTVIRTLFHSQQPAAG